MPLLNLNTLPPGGWAFDQKNNEGKIVKSNWIHRHSAFSDFCQEVLRMRQANGYARATLPQVREEVDEFQCQRLGYDPSFVKKKPVTFQPMKLFSPLHLRGAVQAVADTFTALNDGKKVLSRWLGEGLKPVEPGLAQSRADVCTGRISGTPCPFNQDGFQLVAYAADALRRVSEEKNKLSLKVEGEENLKTCAQCFCHMSTKVWVPIETIIGETPSAMQQKIKREAPHCWQFTESQKLNPAK